MSDVHEPTSEEAAREEAARKEEIARKDEAAREPLNVVANFTETLMNKANGIWNNNDLGDYSKLTGSSKFVNHAAMRAVEMSKRGGGEGLIDIWGSHFTWLKPSQIKALIKLAPENKLDAMEAFILYTKEEENPALRVERLARERREAERRAVRMVAKRAAKLAREKQQAERRAVRMVAKRAARMVTHWSAKRAAKSAANKVFTPAPEAPKAKTKASKTIIVPEEVRLWSKKFDVFDDLEAVWPMYNANDRHDLHRQAQHYFKMFNARKTDQEREAYDDSYALKTEAKKREKSRYAKPLQTLFAIRRLLRKARDVKSDKSSKRYTTEAAQYAVEFSNLTGGKWEDTMRYWFNDRESCQAEIKEIARLLSEPTSEPETAHEPKSKPLKETVAALKADIAALKAALAAEYQRG